MTRHYLDLNSASDWFRSTTQIWVATPLTQIKTDTLIGKFRIPRRPWDEHDCEANASQLLCKNKNKHRQFAAEWLENDRNFKISKLKIISKAKG